MSEENVTTEDVVVDPAEVDLKVYEVEITTRYAVAVEPHEYRKIHEYVADGIRPISPFYRQAHDQIETLDQIVSVKARGSMTADRSALDLADDWV